MEASGTGAAAESTRLSAKERLLLVTLATVAAYVVLHRLPLPGAARPAPWDSSVPAPPPLSVLDLSWRPFFIGFLLTELAAFLLPPLQRLRRGGLAGRRRLTAFAVQVGVGVALVQSATLAHVLESLDGLDGSPLAVVPIPIFRLLVVCSLVAGSVLVYAAGRFLTGRMLAGGLVLFLLVDRLLARSRTASAALRQLSSSAAWKVTLVVLVLALLAIASVEVLRRQRPAEIAGPGGEVVALRLPDLPQGALPLFWVLALLDLEGHLADFVASGDLALFGGGFWISGGSRWSSPSSSRLSSPP